MRHTTEGIQALVRRAIFAMHIGQIKFERL